MDKTTATTAMCKWSCDHCDILTRFKLHRETPLALSTSVGLASSQSQLLLILFLVVLILLLVAFLLLLIFVVVAILFLVSIPCYFVEHISSAGLRSQMATVMWPWRFLDLGAPTLVRGTVSLRCFFLILARGCFFVNIGFSPPFCMLTSHGIL